MAHHYLGGLEVRNAMRGVGPTGLDNVLREADLYPPGHSVGLGTWLLVFGESAESWRLFGWSIFSPHRASIATATAACWPRVRSCAGQ